MQKYIKLTSNESGDWNIIEVNGVRFASGHSISDYTWLELIRVNFPDCIIETDCISDEAMEDIC